ncbi:50S ribosomal protein L15 [Candidatus Peregrinibacteria bacterium]|nr:50S ribosomal protein L15 [Candidatus Peregrinibacteria bacterium]
MEALLKLKRNKGATAKKKRLGRGNGSGLGSYSGRGGKGQTARTGGNIKPGFAGGQTPLYRKMPKYKGFNNINRVEYQVVNLSDLESFFDEGSEVNATTLHAKKLIRSADMPVKLLANGELSKKLSITVNKASDSAKEKLTKSKSTLKVLTVAKSEAKSE